MARGSSGPANRSGVPPGLKFYSAFPFAGMNTESSPVAIADQEFLWVENFFRIGDGKYRTGYDAGSPLYRCPNGLSIVCFYAYTIGVNFYFAVFLSDGSARQVEWPLGQVTQIGPANTFYNANSGLLPACSQYGVIYLLISNRNTVNDYWAWDGKLLYGAGTIAPNSVTITGGGSNYNTQPTVISFGGHGSGVQMTAVVNGGSVVNVNIQNPGSGFEVGDTVQAQFTGGGSDTTPILQATLAGGGVAAANVTAPGTGYTTATVTFSGGGGTGAAGTAVIGTGSVLSVNVTNPGAGYTTATVAFTGAGGTGATAVPTIVGGQITSIDVIDGGTGYTGSPTVSIGGNGTGATATATTDAGQITGIQITSPGSGYTSSPSINITGDGSGALAVAVLQSSPVSAINVVDPGSGFVTAPLLNITGGGGSGAAAYSLLTGTSVQRADVLTGGQDYQQIPNLYIVGGPLNVGKAQIGINMDGKGAVGDLYVLNGGSGYTQEPELLFVTKKGDTGSGATGRAILAPTTIHRIQISNHGLHYSNAPAVIVEPGANNAAYATIGLMPFGLSGSCLETFQSRVWIANPAPSLFDTIPPGGDFAVTAAGSITDVATSDGGVLFTNSDSFLQRNYVNIRQSNGYLYFIGDGSISVVSGVQTSGNPPTTTFNYQSVDLQVGGTWRDAIQDFGRSILVANQTGIYNLVGGSATKISDKMDDIFLNAVPPESGGVTPSGACAHIFDVKHYFMLATITDPDTLVSRTAMITFNGQHWTITSQSPNLIYIGTQKRGSMLFAWGTDGQSLYPLFQTPSTTLQKRLNTKLYGANNPIVENDIQAFYMQAQDQSANNAGISATVAFLVAGVATQVEGFQSVPSHVYTVADFQNLTSEILIQEPNFQAPYPEWPLFGTATAGIPSMNAGARITTTSPDFILGNLLLAYTDGPPKI